MTITATVIPGEVRVAHVDLVRSTPDVVIIEIDFHTKRAVFGCSMSCSDEQTRTFDVECGEETLRPDEALRGTPTQIVVTGIQNEWRSVARLTRYTGTLVFWRPQGDDEEQVELWRSP
jgi:hypothetical protein